MTVYLVGAGPGDPGLLTVRGAELLERADVVVYDRLVHPSLLELAPGTAQRINVGKAPGRAELDQEGINAALVEHGRSGKTVVRLKGGDPFVFGRGGEEAEALADAGVPFEVVPGITSAIAAPAYAGVPVTHRGLSTHFTVVTGHEDPAKGTTDTDWDALARAGGTLVILMGAGRLDEIAQRLIAGGRSPETPVAAVRWGTRADQQTTRATLGTIASAGVQAPSAIVVGPVAALDLGWFERRPLFGRSVVVTRAREQASGLRARLEALGAEVIELPAISTVPLSFTVPALDELSWLVFTSVNGVAAFIDEGIAASGRDVRALAGVKVAAIGPGTASALRDRGIAADLVPERYVAESLLDAFPEPGRDGARVLIARAEQARDVLPEGLASRGYDVDVLAVYRTELGTPSAADVARVRAGEVDAITFTSSSTVTRFVELAGPLDGEPAIFSIGPITSVAARDAGFTVTAEADPHTIDALVGTVLASLGGAEPGTA